MRKAVINLGTFDKEKHIEWLKQNQGKRPSMERKQLSHFYGGGDICDVTKKPRQVEVKLKCKKSDSPSTVSLYLVEPKTCEYVLGVESPLVCDIIPLADKNGLMDITRENFDNASQAAAEASNIPAKPKDESAKPKPPPPTAEESTLKRAPPLKKETLEKSKKDLEQIFEDEEEEEEDEDEDD